jgi:hypothetical protein
MPSLRPASMFMMSRRRSGTRRSRTIAIAGARSTGTTMIASTASSHASRGENKAKPTSHAMIRLSGRAIASKRPRTPRSRPRMPPGTSVASTNSSVASVSSTPRSTILVSRSIRITGCEPAVSTIPTITTAIAVVILSLASRPATSAQTNTTISSTKTPSTTGSTARFDGPPDAAS